MPGSADPGFSGTFRAEDVQILLKPTAIPQIGIVEKERLIQSGRRHYSEMLSPEMLPDTRYMGLYRESLARHAGRLHADIQTLAKRIGQVADRNPIILISLARAGTPIGVLLKREIGRMGLKVHHYSISIIRGRGIDSNALKLIRQRHGTGNAFFIDGWTGKGAIKAELDRSIAATDLGFVSRLAVVADPAGRADLAATVEDYVIPSGLLNGIVSGLISRSVLTRDLVGPEDFHACLFQENHRAHDVTQSFIDTVEAASPIWRSTHWNESLAKSAHRNSTKLIEDLRTHCGVNDINRIKPSIAEATRAILRRVPDAVFVKSLDDPEIRHIRHLAAQSGVPVIARELYNYRAVTIIKRLGGEQE